MHQLGEDGRFLSKYIIINSVMLILILIILVLVLRIRLETRKLLAPRHPRHPPPRGQEGLKGHWDLLKPSIGTSRARSGLDLRIYIMLMLDRVYLIRLGIFLMFVFIIKQQRCTQDIHA